MSQSVFGPILKDHQQQQTALRKEISRKKAVATKAIAGCTEAMLESVNEGVARIFINERKIEQEAKSLQAQTKEFTRQTAQWLKLLSAFNTSLKEIGDVESWAKTIEWEMKTVATALECISKDNAPSQ